MQAADARRFETGISYAAAASFAAAVGFAVFHAVAPITDFAGMVAAGGVAAMVAYPGARVLLRILEGGPRPFPRQVFELVRIEPVERDELLLTESDRFQPVREAEPLELNDILVEIAPDSRVVQLFDPTAMPTAGQLKSRIDRHLDGGTPRSPPPDASEALFEALADLRRSLR
jgi:hypothetical protein